MCVNTATENEDEPFACVTVYDDIFLTIRLLKPEVYNLSQKAKKKNTNDLAKQNVWQI
jgi:hypothetical protein